MCMEEAYKQSLLLIKKHRIRTEKEYTKLAKEHFILNSTTLKMLSNTRDFQEVVKMARRMEMCKSIQ